MQPAIAKPFTFKKRGLTPNEFQDCLTCKVQELFKDFNINRIETLRKDKIKLIRQIVSIRENRTNDRLDRRHNLSLFMMVVNELLPNETTTPMRERQNTAGRRGRQRNDRRVIAMYHDQQHRLFSNFLIPRFEILLTGVRLKEENKGYFFWLVDDKKLTTEECCNVIDQITTKYIDYFSQLKKNTEHPDYLNNLNRADLNDQYHICLLILMGRVVVDWSTENDLMDFRGYNEWRRHVLVEMSYAALAVVLAMILSLL